jgi:hypothetical protein
MLRRLDKNDIDVDRPATRTPATGEPTRLIFSDSNTEIVKINDAYLVKIANRICNEATKELYKKHAENTFVSLGTSMGTMKQTKDELGEALEPLVIRPLILRTRCDLCPA